MNRFPLLSALLFVFALPLAGFAQPIKPVTATLLAEKSSIAPGEPFRVAVRLEHQPEWHVYGKTIEPGAAAKPTKLLWNLPEGWSTEDLPWPETHELVTTGGQKTRGYEGVVHLPAKLIPPASLTPGETVKIELTVDALVCNPSSCMPVKLPLSLDLPVAAVSTPHSGVGDVFASLPGSASATAAASGGDPPAKNSNLGVMLLFAFIGGLILNIMPCVFPVLGIKITSIVKQSGDDKRTILQHGFAYTAGVLASFWVIVALLQIFDISWGGQFQSPLFVFCIVLLFTVMGLNMAGLFEIGASAVGIGSDLTRRSGFGGSFFSGLLATLVSTPCSAPFLAPALVYGLSLTLVPSLLFFTVIGLGLAFPFLLLSFSPALLKKLPRPGAWMESFKQGMSFLMLGAAAFFAWSLQGLVSDSSQRDLLIGMVIIAFALWIYGRWCVISKPVPTRLKAGFTALVFLALGLWWSWPQPKDNLFDEWSPETVQKLQAEGKPVYVDFTARWCGTCQYNKRVYKDQGLRDAFKRHGVTLLKADWTDYDERITQTLAALDRAAVPVNALYIPGRSKPHLLPEILTVENVRAALDELDAKTAGN